MRYLKNLRSREEEQKLFKEYLLLLEKLKGRISSEFLDEYSKHGFHDNPIAKISFERVKLKDSWAYQLVINHYDYFKDNTLHSIILKNVRLMKSEFGGNNFEENFICGCYDILTFEILSFDEKTLSIEIEFSNNGLLYVEFEELFYTKENV